MRIKPLPLVLLIMTLFLYSCGDKESGNGAIPSPYPTRTFRAINTSNGMFYDVRAQLLYEGAKCNIWVESTSNMLPERAQEFADTYDNIIYPRMMSVFNDGTLYQDATGVYASNPMELADYLGDRDGKLAILFLNIRDNFVLGTGTGFVAGYFYYEDFFPKSFNPNSNEADIIYIDTYPGLLEGRTAIYNTIAHEMQHLTNFALSTQKRFDANTNYTYLMDTWVDEGLSEAAQWIWNGQHTQQRIDRYNADPSGMISRGNNFFVWNNHSSTQGAILDDYTTVYLFFQWLRLQSGGTDIYRHIANSEYSDYRAVTTAANAAMPYMGYSSWGTLLRNWLVANYINSPYGPYGYLDDPALKNIQAQYLTGTEDSFPLFPGEGVFTKKTSIPTMEDNNIRYVGLPERGSVDVPSLTRAGGHSTLLSFNADTRINAAYALSQPFSSETAFSEPDIGAKAISRNALSGSLSPISAWDMLRPNARRENNFGVNLSNLRFVPPCTPKK